MRQSDRIRLIIAVLVAGAGLGMLVIDKIVLPNRFDDSMRDIDNELTFVAGQYSPSGEKVGGDTLELTFAVVVSDDGLNVTPNLERSPPANSDARLAILLPAEAELNWVNETCDVVIDDRVEDVGIRTWTGEYNAFGEALYVTRKRMMVRVMSPGSCSNKGIGTWILPRNDQINSIGGRALRFEFFDQTSAKWGSLPQPPDDLGASSLYVYLLDDGMSFTESSPPPDRIFDARTHSWSLPLRQNSVTVHLLSRSYGLVAEFGNPLLFLGVAILLGSVSWVRVRGPGDGVRGRS